MRLSRCEEVAGPPSPGVGVPATGRGGRRVPPGGQRVAPWQEYHACCGMSSNKVKVFYPCVYLA
jgi:hypothetical protein